VRVYPDTNVLVSAMATRGLCADLLQVILTDHQLLVGETVLTEVIRVLERKLHLTPKTISEWEAFLRRQGEVVPTVPPLALRVRDAADRAILAEAVAGRADVLVTGDRDLLVLAPRAPLRIQSPREFWEQLRSAEHEP
jgi:putative PIN family toxin of toxin-antitoxin system